MKSSSSYAVPSVKTRRIPRRRTAQARVREYCSTVGAVYFETSAKQNLGVSEMFEWITNEVRYLSSFTTQLFTTDKQILLLIHERLSLLL